MTGRSGNGLPPEDDAPPPGPAEAPSPDSLPLNLPPRSTPRTRAGATRADAVVRMEHVRVTAPDLSRRAALERTRTRLVFTAGGFVALFAALLFKLALATVIAPLKPPPARHQVATLLAHPKDVDAAALARRAMITDRHGRILAVSLPSAALFADPRQIVDPAAAAAKLKAVLPDLDTALAIRRLSESHMQFVFLDRAITPEQEIAINNLGIPGIDFLPTEERHYPMGRLAAQVLGGVDVDEQGVAGVEKFFNHRLMSDPQPLRLSIDVRVQAVMREELAAAMDEFHAKGACGIVMNVQTGEVLAMVSLPDYDAGDLGHASADARFNRCASGAYEPGSTFKLQTAGMALNDDVIHVWDKFDTVHPIHIGRFTITDFEPAHYDYALPEIIAQSSNIGASHIALLVGADRQRAFLKANGFFVKAPIQLPESAPPLVQPARMWQKATTMTVSFGNGIAVTPIQLIAGTAALIDGGIHHPPTLLALPHGQAAPGYRIVTPATSDLMRKLMRIVVTKGTGAPARVPGYLMGAKTGTSQKVSHGDYRLHTNLSSMLAAFPMTHPRYILYAMLDSPVGNKSTYGFSTGGWTAGPVIKQVIARIGPMLGILPASPQDLPELQQAIYIPRAPVPPPGAPVLAQTPLAETPTLPTPAHRPPASRPLASHPLARHPGPVRPAAIRATAPRPTRPLPVWSRAARPTPEVSVARR